MPFSVRRVSYRWDVYSRNTIASARKAVFFYRKQNTPKEALCGPLTLLLDTYLSIYDTYLRLIPSNLSRKRLRTGVQQRTPVGKELRNLFSGLAQIVFLDCATNGQLVSYQNSVPLCRQYNNTLNSEVNMKNSLYLRPGLYKIKGISRFVQTSRQKNKVMNSRYLKYCYGVLV